MPKVSVLDLPIHVYSPMDPSRMCIAFIGDLPVFVKGKTPLRAKMAADEFRKAEVARLQRKLDRAQ